MQPLQYYLRDPAAKDNSITNAATARSNLDAAITMRSAEIEFQNTIELRATALEIVAPKPDGSRRQSEKKTILKHFLKEFLEGKSLAPKWRKSADKITVAAFMQPLLYDLRDPAAKDNSITNAATARSNLHCGNDPTVAKHNGIPWATHPPTPLAIPFTLRERSYSCKSQWNSIGNSSTSTTCNPIYIAGTILQLQITMEFCRPQMHETQLKPHLQCGTDPTMIRTWSETVPTTHETVSHPSHRRGRSSTFGDGLCMEKHRVSCICYLSKTHFVRDFLQNSIGNSSTSTTCNPIYIAGTILQLQITMEFCRPHMHEKHLKPHLQCGTDPTMIRPWSENDPTTHETVSHPSHRRGRSSTFEDGLCMEKHRLSCICYLSKTHFVRDFLQNSIGNSSTSTTCNPIYSEGTILELQITMEFHRQLIHQHHLQPHLQCGNDPTVANHNGILSTAHARKTLETHLQCGTDPTMIRTWSENDPTTHETVSHPSHRRGRSSRFGDGLCMEKHRLSCICYLSKTHFVRDFHQNSIGNSSTSTTCNPIYSEGTILELQITMEFHRQLIHQHHLQPHFQCGNDPTVANHNGILSTAHARNTAETPFTMRNRSDHDPNMIRDRSDHTRDRLAPVAPQR